MSAAIQSLGWQGPPVASLVDELGPFADELGGRRPIDVEHERKATREIVQLRIAWWVEIARLPAPLRHAAAVHVQRSLGRCCGEGSREAVAMLLEPPAQVRGAQAFGELLAQTDYAGEIARRMENAVGRVWLDLPQTDTTRWRTALGRVHRAAQLYRDARDAFARLHLRLVVRVALRYHGLTLADRVQEGNIGLVMAVERFDPDRGNRFSTLAVWWIRYAISRALEDQSRLIRVPAGLQTTVRHRLAIETDGVDAQQLDELAAAHTGRTTRAKTVTLGRQAMAFRFVDPDDVDALDDTHEDPEASMLRTESTQLALSALAVLSDRERVVVTARYGIGGREVVKLEDLARQLGICRERVRQIELRALQRMRAAFAAIR